MRLTIKSFLVAAFMVSTVAMHAQTRLQYYRPDSQDGLNVFETKKDDTVKFDGIKVKVGGDFALQFQGLSQSNDLVGDTLIELSNNITLPTANLNLDVQLEDGVRLHLRTYLSSKHHTEAWVKGGYLQIDKLDFIKPGFLSGFMEVATLRFGMNDINYGDAHFRRSDNARTIYNPFVGNYIMDAFSTEPFGELTIQKSGLLGVIGVTNGRLNQSPTPGDDGIAMYLKLGYDKQLSDDLRVRLTGSMYTIGDKSTRSYIYGGDRSGSRYYEVLGGINDARAADFEPRFNPGFAYLTAFQINPFVKFQGLEFFGIFEMANNGDDAGGSFTQLGAEALYRFGSRENLYVATRYNSVSGESTDASETQEISRFNIGGGWFMTKNILTKVEYVTSSYSGAGYDGTKYQGAEFSGLMIEAAITF